MATDDEYRYEIVMRLTFDQKDALRASINQYFKLHDNNIVRDLYAEFLNADDLSISKFYADKEIIE